ncbi:MAG: serine hydrolase domain-containing protein [Planctomycetota bacterium]
MLLVCLLLFAQAPFATDLDQRLGEVYRRDEPGVAVLVARLDGSVLFKNGYGVADLTTRTPFSTTTISNTGSISKTFVAFAVLKLVEQGKLRLTDTLDTYFADFEHPEIAKQIRIEHLLSHTSGLPDIRNVDAHRAYFLTARDEENFAPLKKTSKLSFEPGERFEYSNPAFNGLALIVQQRSGMRWQSFIEEEIFAPAGMTESKITDGAFPSKGVAHGYDQAGGEWQEDDYGEFPTFCAAGNGGVWCSVEDLLRYELSIQRGTFLSKELITRSRTPLRPENWRSTAKPAVGFSWFVTESNGQPVISHSGSQGGFRAWHDVYPTKDLIVIWLGNAGQHSMAVRSILNELLVAHHLL